MTSAKAWQIASLVALATNEQVYFSTILKHCTTFCPAKTVIARRHDEAICQVQAVSSYLITTAKVWEIASLVALVRNDSCHLADCTALFIGKNRKPLLTRYLAMTVVCLKISCQKTQFHFSINL